MSSEANYPVVVEKNLPMRARDGVTLFADVYRPAGPELPAGGLQHSQARKGRKACPPSV